jgi:general nucleoside transport system ATP-binding protein
MQRISKQFGATKANVLACIDFYPDEIHAVVGENGAGKSTLMSILAGTYQPDSGDILIDNTPKVFSSTLEAVSAGIGMVYQHPALYDELTVLQNLAIGPPTFMRKTSIKDIRNRAAKLLGSYAIPIDLETPVSELSDIEKEFVAFIGLKLMPLRLMILDEPTATFTKKDEDRYYRMVVDAKNDGVGVALITHKIREVSAIADKVTVMRKGRSVYSEPVREQSDGEIRSLLFGDGDPMEIDNPGESVGRTRRAASSTGSEALRLRSISLNAGGSRRLSDVNLTVRPGEIVVVTGIREFGPQQLEAICTGEIRPTSGSIELNGSIYRELSSSILRNSGVGIIPIDRNRTAVSQRNRIWENLILHRRRETHPHGFLDKVTARTRSERMLQEAGVSARRDSPVSSLSGGMIQRIVLSREIDATTQLFILSEPFRGLDIHGRQQAIEKMRSERFENIGILCFISDIDDVLSVADTVAVFNNGRIASMFTETPHDRIHIENAMLGLEITG